MALIQCSECNHSISDKASTCPHCGAPNALLGAVPAPQQATQQAQPVAAQDGTACPFSGHPVPAGATVCVCGAYYGYKGGVLTDQKFKLLVKLLGASLILLLLGYLAEWGPVMLIGLLGTLVFGTVFLFFALPIRIQGEQWWRKM
jgi:hypothetical protein